MTKKKKYIILSCIFVIALVFAYLLTNLYFNVTATVHPNTFDVHFENVDVQENTAVTENDPVIVGDTEVDFAFGLENPKDYYSFNIDIVNDGTVDAMIDEIHLPELSESEEKLMDVKVNYSYGDELNPKDLLSAGKTETINVKITYLIDPDVDFEDLPSEEGLSGNLSFSMDYVHAKDANPVIHPGIFLTDLDENNRIGFGDEVTIGTEKFYIVEVINSIICALSKSNLDLNTKKQLVSNEDAYNYVNFASTVYWDNEYPQIDLNNESNYINSYLTDYSEYLNQFGKIDYTTLIDLYALIGSGYFELDEPPEWIFSTNYWLDNPAEGNNVIGVYNSRLGTFSIDSNLGIRPLVVIRIYDVKDYDQYDYDVVK